jgi:hypothetical protein
LQGAGSGALRRQQLAEEGVGVTLHNGAARVGQLAYATKAVARSA